MAHPKQHAVSSARKFGGTVDEYLKYHEWFDATKAWIGNSDHRAFRHHSEGIFELEKIFGISFINSENKEIFIRYIGEQHVKEDCYGIIPSASDWIAALKAEVKPMWMLRTLKIED